MTVADANRAQADLWTASGPIWTALRDRFDAQSDAHGVAAIDALAPAEGEHVIDVGCGAGSTTVELAARVGPTGRVTGLDISPTMIEGARAHAAERGHDNIEFVVADAMVDSIGRNADGIFSRFGVMFFADATAAFTNMRAALRPGGRLGFVCWKDPGSNLWASMPLGIASKYVDIPFGGAPDAPGPFSFGDPDRVRTILTDAGFSDVDLSGRDQRVKVGTDPEDAANFLLGLNPMTRSLEGDPKARLQAEVEEAFSAWHTDDGVLVPSATWIVTATNP